MAKSLEKPAFSQELDEYVVLKLDLRDYKSTKCEIPHGLSIFTGTDVPKIRQQEEKMLKRYFRYWQDPFLGHLRGWRNDSRLFMRQNRKLVAGIYLCDNHEFTDLPNWGQLHYFFVHPSFRGRGLHTCLLEEAVKRAREWGLEGLFINTDRHGVPEIYERRGAVLWKRIRKTMSFKNPNEEPYNRVILGIHDKAVARAIEEYAKGDLVDVGCGAKPYALLTEGRVDRHIGVDHEMTGHDRSGIDIFASAYNTTLPSESADTILCTAVLENLEEPDLAVAEMARILKCGGHAIVTTPFFRHRLEEPRDFFRFTKYGLAHLFEKHSFEILELEPLSGFWVTVGTAWNYYLMRYGGGRFRLLIGLMVKINNRVMDRMGKSDRSEKWTWMYLVVACKAKEL